MTPVFWINQINYSITFWLKFRKRIYGLTELCNISTHVYFKLLIFEQWNIF